MRYKLDNEGYVKTVAWGCSIGGCKEYTGTIPTGYESLLEWSEKANINAYYIKDNNLTLDADRDSMLREQQELDTKRNSYVTAGYLEDKLNESTSIYDDTLRKTTTELMIDDAGEYPIPEIVIEGKGDLKTSTNTIEDARAVKSKGIKIEGKTIQDGTPSPTNKVEIQNVEGVTNLCNITSVTGYNYGSKLPTVANSNFAIKEFDSNSFSYSVSGDTYSMGLTNNMYLKPNTTYKFSLFRTDNNVNNYPRTYIYNVDSGGTYTLNKEYNVTGKLEKEFTTSETGIIALGLGVGNNSNGATGTIENIMISEETYNYVPYGRWLEVKSNDNVFDGEMEVGSLNGSTGVKATATNRLRSKNFSDVEPNTTYYLRTINTNLTTFVFEYDENEKYIQRIPSGWASENPLKFVTSATTKKIKFIFRFTNDATMNVDSVTGVELYTKENTALVDMNKKNLFDGKLVAGSYNNTTGIFTEGSSSVLASNINDIKQDEKYYFKGVSGSVRLFFWNDDEFVKTYIINTPISFTANGNKFAFQFLNTLSYDDIKIYQGVETDDYYSFKENDTFKDGLYTQKRAKIILDGSESWNKRSDVQQEDNSYFVNASFDYTLIGDVKKGMSTHFTLAPNSNLPNTFRLIKTSGYAIQLGVPNDIASTTNELKTWLKEQYNAGTPVTIEYELATPIEHNLNYEILELHEGYNNITTNDDLEPNVSVTYNAQKTTFKDTIKLQVSNANLLVNTSLKQTINGLEFVPNEDGTIYIKGEATEDTEYILGGSMENTTPIFMFDGVNATDDLLPMWICPFINAEEGVIELVEGTSQNVRLYANDGVNRELVTDTMMEINEPKYITCATLFLSKGTKIDGVIGVDVRKQDATAIHVQGKHSEIVDINVSKLDKDEKIVISGNAITIRNDLGVERNVKSIKPLNSYEGNKETTDYTLIQCSEAVDITTTYNTKLKMAGFDVTSDGLSVKIYSKYNYTEEDLEKLQNSLVHLYTLTEAEKVKYDISGDGKIMSNDALLMRYMLDYGITTEKPLKFDICNSDLSNMFNFLSVIDGNGNILTRLGVNGLETNNLYVNGVDFNSIVNRYGNLGINTKGGIGLNASNNTYIRTTLEDGKLYQLVATPTGLIYQHHDGTKWNNVWNDSGWINVPLATAVTEGTITGTPKYRKVINKVDIKGSFSFVKTTSAVLLGTLPAGFRPPEQFYFFAPMGGTRIARFYITTSGAIYCEWIYDITSGVAYTGSIAWTSVNVSFYVD